jgi:hypothetical protein
MNQNNIWKLTPTKTESAAAISSEGGRTLTASTPMPNDEPGSSAKSFEPNARPNQRRGYFVRPRLPVIDRLRAGAIEAIWIVIFIIGLIIAALCALDLSDMVRW